ncbi:TetR family transcriptional regulator [Streptomyces oceani]|uniref:TetR family transcriptional regulator n=1 Tax=Streptomyces oceani TaxID=1075402 RepID=A0A1E7KL87_9ACTN|nr:TetR family transcriptional regulator [Streptomyces oceani]
MAADRPAAEPQSPGQRARHERILDAAARLGAEHGLDHVQMHDVAKEAGVAIATLYRYFPSKTHLFTAIMAGQVERMGESSPEIDAAADPVEAVAETLLRSTRHMLRTPRLASAMMQSTYAAHVATVSEAAATEAKVHDTVLGLLGLVEPTDQDNRLVRLLMKSWHGVLISAIYAHSTLSEAETEVRLACEVLLAARSNAPGR